MPKIYKLYLSLTQDLLHHPIFNSKSSGKRYLHKKTILLFQVGGYFLRTLRLLISQKLWPQHEHGPDFHIELFFIVTIAARPHFPPTIVWLFVLGNF